MANDWSREEVEATISDYFDMLAMELRGESFNKAEHNRHLQRLLIRRSAGAIEKKHQNISAVLIELGYDILSFELDGRERLIEVKTTCFGSLTPFFASRNEVGVSESRNEHYQLYRLFNFARQPKMFMLGGSLRETCRLEPIQFSAVPK